MFAISPTDLNWFNSLKNSELNSFVNFWTPTPWNVRKLNTGDRLYFMLKSPIRKIGGFGEFYKYKNLTAEEAWNEFGFRNGRNNKNEFVSSIHDYLSKDNSENKKSINSTVSPQIGCIILTNCQYWEEHQYIDLATTELEFASQVVKIKYYNQYDSLLNNSSNEDNFNILREEREQRKGSTNLRIGQSNFKGILLKAYNNECCVTCDKTPELLEAAHIQEYKSEVSNHVQNGLLLRVDIHRLYDNNLLFIDENYIIHISNLVSNSEYLKLHGQKINLPIKTNHWPNREALEMRRYDFREI